MQNLGLAVISMFSGLIVDEGGYFMLEIFFIGWLVSKYSPPFEALFQFHNLRCFVSVSLIATIVIWLYNSNNNGVLNMSPSERDSHANKL